MSAMTPTRWYLRRMGPGVIALHVTEVDDRARGITMQISDQLSRAEVREILSVARATLAGWLENVERPVRTFDPVCDDAEP